MGFGLPPDWSFWARQDEAHLRRCNQVLVLPVDGWKESQGVQAEIEIAKWLGIPVSYVQERDVCATLPTGSHHAHPGYPTLERNVGRRSAPEKKDHP